nr:sigma-54-dependent Fis family transcriptional regulator [Clostridia bacterium]
EALYRTLQGLGFTVLLTDHDGYILKTVGDAGFLDKAKRVCLSAGANWSENIKGTNAIGTALKEANPVNVFG